MYWQKWYKKSKVYEAAIRLGRWKASDHVGEIKDKIYVLPCLCFYFNSSEIFFMFAWLNVECWAHYTDFNKPRIS